MSLQELVLRNRRWAMEVVSRDPDYFSRHLGGQSPVALYIGCADARVAPELFLGCQVGELFTHTNVANVVDKNDFNLGAVLEYAVSHLHIQDIILCGHYGCGGVEAACSGGAGGVYLGEWIKIVAQARKLAESTGAPLSRLDHADFLRAVVEENVRFQVHRLREHPLLQDAWSNTPGIPRVHGWVYELADGNVSEIVAPGQHPYPQT